tara:strand:+ start:380 stop:547 length:168 start_codon:yes stop_codon:yes gene_type:complete
MKDTMESVGGFLLMALFVCGYFPVNMILAFIYGDKIDLLISFFIPFYGLFITFFG